MKQKSGLSPSTTVVLMLIFTARTAANGPVKIMPLGDSITRGCYGSAYDNGYRKPLYLSLTSNGYNFDFVGGQSDGNFEDPNHQGHDGWHAARDGTDNDILAKVYDFLAANPAEIVLLHIGTNDITAGGQDAYEVNDILNEIDRYEADYDKNITVIVALIINRKTYSPATTQFNRDVNDIALNRIANGDDIIIVDMESALDYETDMYDDLHPNDDGYAKMADVWYDALDNLVSAPAIISTPVEDGTVGQLYTYDVDANGYPQSVYALTEHPNGMTIDSNTGLIQWIATAAGDFNVTVVAGNGQMPDANQTFIISVGPIIKFDAGSSACDGSSGNMLTWLHTLGSGQNRILVVGLAAEDNKSDDLVIAAVTYNNVSMNFVQGSAVTVPATGQQTKTELYYLPDANLPSTGTYSVSVLYQGSVSARIGGAVSLKNVKQQPPEAVVTNSNTGSYSIFTNITTVTNGAWVVDVAASGDAEPNSFEAVGGMAERWESQSGGAGHTAAGSTKLVESAGITAVGWTHTNNSRLAHSAAAFTPKTPTICGHICEPNNNSIEGVLLSAEPNEDTSTTDVNGCYELIVPYGWNGTVTPIKTGYIFAPYERVYSNVLTDRSHQDYKDITAYDLDDSGVIDWGDIKVIHQNWLGCGSGDIDDDGIVNFFDFAELGLAW